MSKNLSKPVSCPSLRAVCLTCWTSAALAATSCDRATDMSDRIRVDTLSSGRVLVSNPDRAAVSDNAVARLIEDLRIGHAAGERSDAPDVFGSIIALAADDAGRIYVADHQSNDIRVFDATGSSVGRIGRKGEGPGEFRFLAGVAWQREDGILWAMDPVRHRLIAFDSTGALLHENRHGDFTFATIPWTGKTDANRFLFDERRKDVLVRHRTLPTGEVVASDTLRLPPVETNTYATESEGVTALSSVPMSPYRVWTAAPDGNAWLAVTSSYEMHEVTFAGDTVRTVKLLRSASPLEGEERDSIAAASRIPARRLPRRKPVFRSLNSGPDGQLWVEVGAGEVARRWDVFDRSGYYLGRVESPIGLQRSTARLVVGAGTVIGVVEDEVGVQHVVRFRVPERFGPES